MMRGFAQQRHGSRVYSLNSAECRPFSGVVMGPTQNETQAEPDHIDTVPASKVLAEAATPNPDTGWDSEAPTAVHTRRPLFARPPRLPSP